MSRGYKNDLDVKVISGKRLAVWRAPKVSNEKTQVLGLSKRIILFLLLNFRFSPVSFLLKCFNRKGLKYPKNRIGFISISEIFSCQIEFQRWENQNIH